MGNSIIHERSLPKGLLAGLIGGIVGAAVLVAAKEAFSPDAEAQPGPHAALGPGEIAMPAPAVQAALKALPWAVGAVAGGIYGAAVELEPSLAAWRGAAFGLAVNRFANESFLPRMGLVPPPEEQSTQVRVSAWISHAAYGIATDTVRRLLRRMF
jgi:putative membrane protein